jgi:hypothetical protein
VIDQRDAILSGLAAVEAERRRRQADPLLASRVDAVKQFQHRRFSKTYADLLLDADTGAAARFFLDELYGPKDFARRDEEFARIVPGLVKVFPKEVISTVARLAELHALSEVLDSRMALACMTPVARMPQYVEAWKAVGEAASRERQIVLTLEIGSALIRFTRHPLLRSSLRLMRGPARAAGLGTLQQFLEVGFDTFTRLRSPRSFLDTIASREREFIRSMSSDP